MPARAGRWLGSGQVVRCLYQAGYPADMAATRRKTWPFRRGKTLTVKRHPGSPAPAGDPQLVMDPQLGCVEADGQRQRDLDGGQHGLLLLRRVVGVEQAEVR